MTSNYETFWGRQVFAVVGHLAGKNFPRLTYHSLHKWMMKAAGRY